jgi:hypothetical protein
MFFILIDLFYTIVSVDFIKNPYFILFIVFLQFDAATDGGVYPFIKIPDFIAHNVPGVYDVLPACIRALRSKDQGWQNVGGGSRGRRSRPRRLEPPEPPNGGGAYTVLLCAVLPLYRFLSFLLFFIYNVNITYLLTAVCIYSLMQMYLN